MTAIEHSNIATGAPTLRGARRLRLGANGAATRNALGIAVAHRRDEILNKREKAIHIDEVIDNGRGVLLAEHACHITRSHRSGVSASRFATDHIIKFRDIGVLYVAARQHAGKTARMPDRLHSFCCLCRAVRTNRKAANRASNIGVLDRRNHNVERAQQVGQSDALSQQAQSRTCGGSGSHVNLAGPAAGITRRVDTI